MSHFKMSMIKSGTRIGTSVLTLLILLLMPVYVALALAVFAVGCLVSEIIGIFEEFYEDTPINDPYKDQFR